MKFNGEIMHFHPGRPDRLLGLSRSGELWAVVGKIEFSNTRPIDGWVRLSGDNPATITDVGGNVFKLHQQQRTAQPPLRGEVVGRRLDVLLRAQIHFGRRS